MQELIQFIWSNNGFQFNDRSCNAPIGLVLYVVSDVSGERFEKVVKDILPFVADVVCLILNHNFPQPGALVARSGVQLKHLRFQNTLLIFEIFVFSKMV